jgi:hypothetical protein
MLIMKTFFGETCLLFASQNRHSNVVDYLRSKGANN